MNTPLPEKLAHLAPDQPSGLVAAWRTFWFTPSAVIALHGVRAVCGLLFLLWLLPMAGHVQALFGLGGWFDARAYVEAALLPNGPPRPIGWSLLFLAGESPQALAAMYWASIAVVVLYTLGAWTRITAVLTWLILASFRANPALYGPVDDVLGAMAFYVMLGYLFLPHPGPSLLARALGSHAPWDRFETERTPRSLAVTLSLRLLQAHLAILITVLGLRKLQFGEWWAGIAFWYDLYSPFAYSLADLLKLAPIATALLFGLSLAAYAVLAWQIGFVLFAWQPRYRAVLLGGAVLGWIGAATWLGLPLVGPTLVTASLCFLTAGEWQGIADRISRLGGLLVPKRAVGLGLETPKAPVSVEGRS